MAWQHGGSGKAWLLSLVLHGGLVLALVVAAGRAPRMERSVVIETLAPGSEYHLALLEPRALVNPRTLPMPAITQPPQTANPPTIPESAPPPVPSVKPADDSVARAAVSAGPTEPAAAPIRPVSHTESPAAPAGVAPPGRAPLPAGVATQFYGVQAQGRSIVYVIDRSASMGLESRYFRAKAQLALSLQYLPPEARFQVIAYNRQAEPARVAGQAGLLPAREPHRSEVLAYLASLRTEGGSDHLRALRVALLLQPDVVYFLTDEDDLTVADARTISQVNRGRCCIHAFCMVPPRPGEESPMQLLARLNRGRFQVVAE